MAANSIVVNTILNTAGFNRGAANMRNSIFSLSGTISKLGMMIAGAFSVTALVNFGKSAIELGSDLSEVQNVVDVTFGNMSSKIDDFAENAIKQFGLSEKSAKQYASTMGAMLKSMGFDTGNALDMSTTLTGLAGDLASFYNLTSDEAFAKIRSGISGETEPLKQLGINLSVANLEAFALANGITKSYDAMTEQEKAMLRYNYLLKATSDAQGDFARTSQGWANQTRILSEQFNSLKATIGQGLINAFTPVVRWLNTIIAKLQTVADGFKALTEYLFGTQETEKAKESLEDVAQGYDDITASTEEATKAQKNNLSGLEELNVIGKENSETTASGVYGEEVSVEEVKNAEDSAEATDKMQEAIGKLKKDYPKLLKFFENTSKKLKEIKYDFEIGDFGELGGDVSDLAVGFYNFITEALGEVDWKGLGEDIGDFLAGIDWIEVIKSGIKLKFNIWKAVADVWFGMFDAAPVETAIITSLATLKFTGLGAVLSDAISKAIGGSTLVNAVTSAFSSLGGIGGILTMDMATIVGAGSVAEIGMAIGTGIIGGIIAAIAGWNIGQELYEFINGEEIEMTFSEQMGAIIESFKDGSWKDAISLWGQDIKSAFVYIWDETVQGIKAKINLLIAFINAMLSSVAGGINTLIESLNGFSFEMPEWLKYTSYSPLAGKTFQFNIPKITSKKIPYLATGAVIPPNAPFMAMLGDQKSGNNIEAPEGLLRQIVREEMASVNVTFSVEGDPYGIFKVSRKQAQEYYDRTGKPPFPT